MTAGRDVSRYELYRSVRVETAASWAIDTVVPGGRLWGANGIRIAPDGRLWIAEVAGNQVSRWDPRSDVLDLVVGLDGPIATPDDVAFDRAGVGYVTTMHAGEVWAVALDGSVRLIVDGIANNNGIAVDRHDRVLVDQMMSGGRIYELSGPTRGEARVVAADLEFPNAFAEGPDGRLYVQEMRAGRVLAIDEATGRREVVADGFDVPTSVRFDDRGDLVVTEAGAGHVSVTEVASGARRIRARGTRGLDNCCLDPAGNLYVSNFADGCILRFPAGRADPDLVVADPALVDPCGLAAWDQRSVLVADHMGTVQVGLDGTRRQVTILQDHRLIPDHPPGRPFTPYLVGVGRIGDRRFVGLTSSGGLYDMDLAAGRIEHLPYGSGADAVGTGPDGALVAVSGDRTILEVGPAGAPIRAYAVPLRHVSAVTADGSLLAACDADAGELAIVAGGTTRVVGGLPGAAAVAILDDAVVVALGDGTVVRQSRDGSRRDRLASGLPFGLPAGNAAPAMRRQPSLLALGDGSVVVGCDGDGSLRRLRPVDP